ncbi:MAG: transposase zinc-binding domain-containing protein, partial [Polyangiaceae bacterium]
MALSQPARPTNVYRQHRSEQTGLYRLVAEHFESFLLEVGARYSKGLPPYVEREFRKYLECGIHAFGFLRARCKTCQKELLVAFSCKQRGVCPSCNARRMCGTAAHLTDRVLPSVALRQWVLSVPFELRLLLAKNPHALSAVGRLFVREVFHWQRERARMVGVPRSRSGAICFVQRFGGSLNLNVHYHVVIPDGVFSRAGTGSAVRFEKVGAPNGSELEDLALAVEARVIRWLERQGLLVSEASQSASEDSEPPESSALEACLAGSLGIGQLVRLKSGTVALAPDVA